MLFVKKIKIKDVELNKLHILYSFFWLILNFYKLTNLILI